MEVAKTFMAIFKEIHAYFYIVFLIIILWTDNFYILSGLLLYFFLIFFCWLLFTICILFPLENYLLGTPEKTPKPEQIFSEYYEVDFLGSPVRMLKYNFDSSYTYIYAFLFLLTFIKLNYVFYINNNMKIKRR